MDEVKKNDEQKFSSEISIKQALQNTLRRNLITVDGNFSLMKIGALLVSLAYIITQLPQEGVFIAPALMVVAKIVMAIGGYFGLVGMRDALKK